MFTIATHFDPGGSPASGESRSVHVSAKSAKEGILQLFFCNLGFIAYNISKNIAYLILIWLQFLAIDLKCIKQCLKI